MELMHESHSAILIGILALIVIFYRISAIGYPLFREGLQKRNIGLIFKSFTQLG